MKQNDVQGTVLRHFHLGSDILKNVSFKEPNKPTVLHKYTVVEFVLIIH